MAGKDRDPMERLKRQLYRRDGKVETGEERTKLAPDTAQAPTGWSDIHPAAEATPPAVSLQTKDPLSFMSRKPSASFAAKFLLGSVLFFLAATGVAAYMFFGGGNLISPQNIDMEIVAPSLVDGGKEATFDVLIRNRNQTTLELVDLVIDYPEGARSTLDPTRELTHERQSIGTIAPGQQLKRTVSAIFYGSEGVEQVMHMTLEYSVAGSNSVFEKKAQASFTIGSSPVSLSIKSPEGATSGDPFSMEVEVRSNSTTPVSDIAVQVQYPFGFSLSSADPKPQTGTAMWRLGTLKPGESRVIKIAGTIQGQDGDERIFRFFVGSSEDSTDTKIEVPFLVVPQTLTVKEPFIAASIAVGGRTDNISASAGQQLQGTVTWRNNLGEPISNVEISLSFVGPALDTSSISAPTGFYQSANSSIIWTKDKESSLERVDSGDSETLPFTFSTLPTGAGGVLITNPIINLSLNVRGVRQDGDNKPETISSVATARVELTSKPSLFVEVLHFSGPFSNSGPMPPRAEDDTTYTIIWTVNNSSNTLANTIVSTTIPPYVTFLSAQQGSGVTYDEGSHIIKWNVGELKPGVGYTLPMRQAAFQVKLTPSASQVGDTPLLTGSAVFSAQDRFTQASVQASANAPTTQLEEPGFESNMSVVAPK